MQDKNNSRDPFSQRRNGLTGPRTKSSLQPFQALSGGAEKHALTGIGMRSAAGSAQFQPLGIYAKLRATFPGGESGPRLGNNTKLPDTPTPQGLRANLLRENRYALRTVAEGILGRKHRVSSCQKVPSYHVQQGEGERGISKNETGKAFFHGVGACGDVHCCPVCSHRISEGRRLEVVRALSEHRKTGGIALFQTFTFPHHVHDALADNLSAFRAARSDMITSRRFREVKKGLGLVGYIRRLEVTWGEAHGWHPHDHEILLIERGEVSPAELAAVGEELYQLWVYYCKKHGLGKPSRRRGYDLQWRDEGTEAAGAYVTKWGHELTYSHTKGAKTVDGAERYTPWGMLQALLEGPFDHRLHRLFKEYAEAFKGRAQSLWSRGLKDLYGVKEASDKEISDRPAKVHYCDITPQHHAAIIFYKKFTQVLKYAEENPPGSTLGLLDTMAAKMEQDGRDAARYEYERKRSIRDYSLKRFEEIMQGD